MAELGWLALRLPEKFGGFGMGAVESALIMEAAGKSLAVEPVLNTGIIGATAITLGADDALGEELGPPLAAGECRVALAYAEPKSRYALNIDEWRQLRAIRCQSWRHACAKRTS